MYFLFAGNCSVFLDKPPSEFLAYLRKESISAHEVPEIHSSPDIVIGFKNVVLPVGAVKLHPGAFFDESMFGLTDEEGRVVQVDYSLKDNYYITADRNISSHFLWEILFDFIKLVLLPKGIAVLHAAGFASEKYVSIMLGWDGAGKSSLLLKEIQKGSLFIGDDRLFFSENNEVFPLYKSIRQFPHELNIYRTFQKTLPAKKRIFIRISQILQQAEKKSRSTLIIKTTGLLYKILRKLSLNIVIIPVSKAKMPSDISIKNIYFVENSESGSRNIKGNKLDAGNIAANIMHEDMQMIRRYYIYRFWQNSLPNELLDNYLHYLLKILANMNFDNVKYVRTNKTQNIETIAL